MKEEEVVELLIHQSYSSFSASSPTPPLSYSRDLTTKGIVVVFPRERERERERERLVEIGGGVGVRRSKGSGWWWGWGRLWW